MPHAKSQRSEESVFIGGFMVYSEKLSRRKLPTKNCP